MKKLLLLLLSICPMLSLNAQTMFIDFTNTATGSITPGNWNNFAQGSSYRITDETTPFTLFNDLIDSSGSGTGISLSYTGAISANSGSAGETYTGTIGSLPTTATEDTFFLQGTITFAYSGLLTDGTLYDLSFTSGANDIDLPNDIPTIYTVNGDDQTALAELGQTVTFSSIAPDSGGNIEFSIAAGIDNVGFYNAFELTVVPEPASGLLFALGLGTLVLRRQSRS